MSEMLFIFVFSSFENMGSVNDVNNDDDHGDNYDGVGGDELDADVDDEDCLLAALWFYLGFCLLSKIDRRTPYPLCCCW